MLIKLTKSLSLELIRLTRSHFPTKDHGPKITREKLVCGNKFRNQASENGFCRNHTFHPPTLLVIFLRILIITIKVLKINYDHDNDDSHRSKTR